MSPPSLRATTASPASSSAASSRQGSPLRCGWRGAPRQVCWGEELQHASTLSVGLLCLYARLLVCFLDQPLGPAVAALGVWCAPPCSRRCVLTGAPRKWQRRWVPRPCSGRFLTHVPRSVPSRSVCSHRFFFALSCILLCVVPQRTVFGWSPACSSAVPHGRLPPPSPVPFVGSGETRGHCQEQPGRRADGDEGGSA